MPTIKVGGGCLHLKREVPTCEEGVSGVARHEEGKRGWGLARYEEGKHASGAHSYNQQCAQPSVE